MISFRISSIKGKSQHLSFLCYIPYGLYNMVIIWCDRFYMNTCLQTINVLVRLLYNTIVITYKSNSVLRPFSQHHFPPSYCSVIFSHRDSGYCPTSYQEHSTVSCAVRYSSKFTRTPRAKLLTHAISVPSSLLYTTPSVRGKADMKFAHSASLTLCSNHKTEHLRRFLLKKQLLYLNKNRTQLRKDFLSSTQSSILRISMQSVSVRCRNKALNCTI